MNIDRYTPEKTPLPLERSRERAPDALKKLFRNRQSLEWEMGTGYHSGPVGRRKGYQLTLWSLLASTIDGLLLVSMSCVFLMAFVKITHIPVSKISLVDLGLSYLIGSWLYMITTRFFIGSSIGEAACDIRLGKPQDRLSGWYFLRVVARSTLVAATGVVVLPVLSLIAGRDIPGAVSGIKLFSLK